MIKKIAHIGITVENLEKGIKFYKSIGFTETKRFKKNDTKLEVAFLEKDGFCLEIFEFENPEDPHAKIISKHTAFQSDDLENDLEVFLKNGFEVAIPIKKGVTVKRYAFLKDGNGNVFELIEK